MEYIYKVMVFESYLMILQWEYSLHIGTYGTRKVFHYLHIILLPKLELGDEEVYFILFF